MITFSNPRLRAEIQNYPIGGSQRGLCVFEIQYIPKGKAKGWKFFRTTTGKPKGTIAAGGKGCIVDGDNGRTYLIQRGGYGGIAIWASTMYCATVEELGFDHYVTERDAELFAMLNGLIDTANAGAVAG